MKKTVKILSLVLVFMLLFSSCKTNIPENVKTDNEEEIRGIWVSVYDISDLKGLGKEGFINKTEKMFEKMEQDNINNVFLQVRACSDAIYPSKIFPWSKFVLGNDGKIPGYDPLKIMIRSAHAHNIRIHAWINPYRISNTSNDISEIPRNSPALKLYNSSKSNMYISDSGIWFNPASSNVRSLILDGVREIINNYSVDGIHIDDYFYPSDDEEIDLTEWNEYIKNGGTLNKSEWRKKQVNIFISSMYRAVKAVDKSIVVSISPCGDIEKNENDFFADVKLWCESDGYTDWIIPQLYYGFKNQNQPFIKAADKWKEIVKNENVKLIAGLSAYKCGEEDYYAGKGKTEWKNNCDILSRQLSSLREKQYGGFCLFSYKSIYNPNEIMEIEWEYFLNEEAGNCG